MVFSINTPCGLCPNDAEPYGQFQALPILMLVSDLFTCGAN